MKKALLWGAAMLALFVVAGCPEETPDPPKPFTLTVTDFPAGAYMGASLLGKDDITKPIATGTPGMGASSNVFTFYHPGSDGKMPSAKPFNTSGKYVIALADIEFVEGVVNYKAVYFYKDNQSEISFPVKTPLKWDEFTPEEQQ